MSIASSCDSPCISVVTVVLNDVDFIEETIRSVLSQKFESLEYIIVDGGSTDGTLEKIRAYESQIDQWISEPDNGVYDAMNKGIALCRGRVVKIINSGDTLCKDAIKTAMASFQGVKGDFNQIIRSFLNLIDVDGEKLWLIDETSASRHYPSILHPSWYVPKQIYDNVGRYDTRYFVAADYEFFQRAVKQGVEFVTIKSPLVCFRTGGISGSGLRGQNEVFRINCRYKGIFVACIVYLINFAARVRNRFLKFSRLLAVSSGKRP